MLKAFRQIFNTESFRKNLPLIIIAVLLHLLISYLVSVPLSSGEHTLNHIGGWTSTKSLLDMNLPGNWEYTSKPQALAGDNLNLGAWHGFQEVLLNEPLDISTLSFDAVFHYKSYLLIIFNKTQDEFEALRISTDDRFPPAYIKGHTDGEFITKLPLNSPLLQHDRTYRIQMEFNTDTPVLTISGQEAITFPSNGNTTGMFGFRSGANSVKLDNIRLVDTNGHEQEFTFDKPSFSLPAFIKALGLTTAVILLIVILTRLSKTLFREQLFATLLAQSLLLIGLILIGLTVFDSSKAPALFTLGHHIRDKLRGADWAKRIDIKHYPIEEYFHPQEEQDPLIIMVIGSSQTWGAGASSKEKIFVQKLEDRLNKQVKNIHVDCIPAAIPGFKIADLAELYTEQWIDFEPDLTVINLAYNDKLTDPEKFTSSLKKIYKINTSRDIQTVFILEPNSIEFNSADTAQHATIRTFAAEHAIPLIDLHHQIWDRHDTGLIWWDAVHFTDFGHRLAAGILSDFLLSEFPKEFKQEQN